MTSSSQRPSVKWRPDSVTLYAASLPRHYHDITTTWRVLNFIPTTQWVPQPPLLEVIVGVVEAIPCVMSRFKSPLREPPSEACSRLEMSSPEIHISEMFRVLIVKIGVGELVVERFELFGRSGFLIRSRHDGGKLPVFAVQNSSVS